jgi:hypothetical protein
MGMQIWVGWIFAIGSGGLFFVSIVKVSFCFFTCLDSVVWLYETHNFFSFTTKSKLVMLPGSNLVVLARESS